MTKGIDPAAEAGPAARFLSLTCSNDTPDERVAAGDQMGLFYRRVLVASGTKMTLYLPVTLTAGAPHTIPPVSNLTRYPIVFTLKVSQETKLQMCVKLDTWSPVVINNSFTTYLSIYEGISLHLPGTP